MSVRFSVLGPVRAWRGEDELDLRPRQLQLMLALLLVRAGRPVTPEELAAVLWGDDRPAQAANIIHRHVGTLRRLFEPDLPARAAGRWLLRQASGYRLDVDAESLDLLSFRENADRARSAFSHGDHDGALTAGLAALRAWHGRCAAGLDLGSGRLAEFAAIDQERSVVACFAADAAVRTGALRDLVPVLREVADQERLDEAVQARLLLALAADGKQAEAVSAYENVRHRLADELGVDPGPELRAAYDQVLHQKVTSTPVPAQAPLSTRFFSGRQAELDRLTALLPASAPSTVVTIDGLPGTGKTTLIVHWAHQAAGHFPDGQLFIDLRGFDAHDAVAEPTQALSHFLSALGVPHAHIPVSADAQATLYRSLMAGRRMLVILDNARDAEQVRPLLPAAPGCLVVVTSRNRLTGLIAQEGAHRLALEPPSPAEARAGLIRRLGTQRGASDPAALDEIIDRCGRLPLAMAVVAARAAAYPEWSLREIAYELSESRSLDAFSGDDPRSDVRNVFSWSYRMLSEPAARLFRLLSVHPGPDFGPATAASLAGVPVAEAKQLLGELIRTRLLQEHRRLRFAFHDLILLYARELTEREDRPADRDEALVRVLDHLRHTAYVANSRLQPPSEQLEPPPPGKGVYPEEIGDVARAMSWFGTELAVLEAAIGEAGVPGLATWPLAESLLPYYQRLGKYQSWDTTASSALRAVQLAGDREGQAHMHRVLAGAKLFTGDHSSAVAHLMRALEIFEELGRRADQGFVYCNLGWVRYDQDDIGRSRRHYEQALAVFEGGVNRRGEAHALLGIGYCLAREHDGTGAVWHLRRAATIFEELGDDNSGGNCAEVMGEALADLGRFDEAIGSRRRAERLFRRARNQMEIAMNGRELGDLYQVVGRHADAQLAWGDAHRVLIELSAVDLAADLAERLATARVLAQARAIALGKRP